jgi:hypothetical protein
MTKASRRTFLATTGTGVAAAAALAAAPSALASGASPEHESAGGEPDLVAYVQDTSTGVLTLLVGEEEFAVHDPALVRSLARAARR